MGYTSPLSLVIHSHIKRLYCAVNDQWPKSVLSVPVDKQTNRLFWIGVFQTINCTSIDKQTVGPMPVKAKFHYVILVANQLASWFASMDSVMEFGFNQEKYTQKTRTNRTPKMQKLRPIDIYGVYGEKLKQFSHCRYTYIHTDLYSAKIVERI